MITLHVIVTNTTTVKVITEGGGGFENDQKFMTIQKGLNSLSDRGRYMQLKRLNLKEYSESVKSTLCTRN